MIQVTFITASGDKVAAEAEEGLSLLEVGQAAGMPLEDVVARANVAAYYNALQLGPYPAFTPEKQREAQARATKYTAVQTAQTHEEIIWTSEKF